MIKLQISTDEEIESFVSEKNKIAEQYFKSFGEPYRLMEHIQRLERYANGKLGLDKPPRLSGSMLAGAVNNVPSGRKPPDKSEILREIYRLRHEGEKLMVALIEMGVPERTYRAYIKQTGLKFDDYKKTLDKKLT